MSQWKFNPKFKYNAWNDYEYPLSHKWYNQQLVLYVIYEIQVDMPWVIVTDSLTNQLDPHPRLVWDFRIATSLVSIPKFNPGIGNCPWYISF